MRRPWCGLVLAGWVGAAAAQPPRPATPDVVFVAKTAGQPDRRLKLVKMFTGADGERLAEVQDVAGGGRYQVPAAALAGMTRAAADPAPPARQPVATGGKFPTSLPLPVPSAGGYSPFAARPLPAAAPPRPAPPAPQPSLDTPLTAMVGGRPAPPSAVLTTPAPTRAAEPPRPMPMPVVAPPAPVEPVRPPVAEPPPVAAVPPVRPVAHQFVPPPPARPAWELTRAEQMRAEVEPYTHDLVHALRPSARERAAQALANGRHASQPEVKQFLAQVARTDPAPTVQARCVAVLSALGYHAREYVEFLEEAAGSPHPGLRQAAVAALARLVPR